MSGNVKNAIMKFKDGEELDIEIANYNIEYTPNKETKNGIVYHFNSDPVTLTFENVLFNYKACFNISNNARRLYGGFALREHARYTYWKRKGKKLKNNKTKGEE